MRKDPEATRKYARDRYLRLKNGKIIIKKPKNSIKIGQRINIGHAVCVGITPHFFDFAIEDFIGHAPVIRINRIALLKWAWGQENKKKKRRKK